LRKKKKGLEKGEPLQPPSKEKRRRWKKKKGRKQRMMNLCKKRKLQNKSLALQADSTGST